MLCQVKLQAIKTVFGDVHTVLNGSGSGLCSNEGTSWCYSKMTLETTVFDHTTCENCIEVYFWSLAEAWTWAVLTKDNMLRNLKKKMSCTHFIWAISVYPTLEREHRVAHRLKTQWKCMNARNFSCSYQWSAKAVSTTGKDEGFHFPSFVSVGNLMFGYVSW